MDTDTRTQQRLGARRAAPIAVAAGAIGWLLLLALSAGRIRDELAATLHRDEAIAWTYASLPLRDIPDALTLDVNPPVYFLALHTWLSGGVSGETYLRVLSVLAILAAAAVSFDAARRLGGRRAGWLASAFVVLAPSTLALAGLARPYALAFLLAVIALDAAIVMVRGGSGWSVAVLGVSGALLPLTHYWGGLLLVSILLGVAVTALLTGRRWLLSRTVIATGIALVAAIPWVSTLLQQLGNHPLAAHQVPSVQLLGTTLTAGLGGRATSWVLAVVAALAVLALLRQWRQTGVRPRVSAIADPGRLFLVTTTMAAVAAVLVLWGISQVRPLFTPNYAFIVLAPVPILVGVWLSSRRWTMAAVIAALVVVALPDFTRSAFPSVPWVRESRGPEYRIALALERATAPGDVVVTSPGRVLAIRYYLGGDREYVTPIGRVTGGTFDFRDRVSRLQQTDAAAVAEELAQRPPGTRIAFVHDSGAPWDHPYWIELDRAMDAVGRRLVTAEEVTQVRDYRLPGPNDAIDLWVFEVDGDASQPV